MRQDPLTGQWVILAEERQGRPNEFAASPAVGAAASDCPFCPGHENQTTAEIMAIGRPPGQESGPGWRVRVFGNMYPALPSHEVVAYTPDHDGSLGRLSASHLTEVLQVIRSRMQAMPTADPTVRHVLPFCNHGPQAGATLSHPHLQILGNPEVPVTVTTQQQRFREHRIQHGTCLLCDLLERELGGGERLVAANEGAVCLTPWASRCPWEMRVVPRRHQAQLELASDEEMAQVAEILQSGLARLEKIHQYLSYNVVFFSDAVEAGGDFHWHVDILPRLTQVAGFELGSGMAINTLAPEIAAHRLREVD
jgi:UDPglucose--hexose-1-phosphate uridylyltransferase